MTNFSTILTLLYPGFFKLLYPSWGRGGRWYGL